MPSSLTPSSPTPSRADINFAHRVSPRDLPEWMDGDCSYEEFLSCLRSLEQVNRWLLGYRPTLAWLERLPRPSQQPIHIVDVGSGGGGLLRQIARWARKRGTAVRLTGIDLNPYAARAAADLSPTVTARHEPNIAWVTGDALLYRPDQPIDVVVSSLMTHHLEEAEIVAFLRWMESSAHLGWFINDLERSHPNSRIFAGLAAAVRWHPFVRHDGPVSFRRAFRKQDWLRLLALAHIPQNAVTIEHWRPGRLCVGRWKQGGAQ